MTSDGAFVFLIQPNGKLRKLNAQNGNLVATWDARWEGEAATDIDTAGDHLVACYPQHSAVRWIDKKTGQPIHEVGGLQTPRALTVRKNGEVIVGTKRGLVTVSRAKAAPQVRVRDETNQFQALDVDHATGDVYVVDKADGETILRFAGYRLVQSYGGKARAFGRYDPTRFAGVSDIAADGLGGFYVTEPASPPRRVAHFAAESGKLLREWYGGQSFYIDTAVDRVDPTNVWGCAGEGFVHHYKLDYDTGKWTIHATYQTGRLGDSMFPFAGKWRPVRRGGKLFLVHGSVPAVLRVDEEAGKAVACRDRLRRAQWTTCGNSVSRQRTRRLSPDRGCRRPSGWGTRI